MANRKLDAYLPVCVEVEIDDDGKPVNIGDIRVDYDGAPWREIDKEDDVWDNAEEEWMPRAQTFDIADYASNQLMDIVRLVAKVSDAVHDYASRR